MKKNVKYQILQGLIILNSILWIALGIMGYVRYLDLKAEWLLYNSILMIVNAIISAFVFYLIYKRKAWIYYPALVYFIAVAILSVTDEIGLYDILAGVFTLLIVVMILLNRKLLLGVKTK